MFLIGNKTDKEDVRKVPRDVAENYAKDNSIDYFSETSAKTGFNAKNVFLEAAKCLYIEHLKYKDRSSRPGSFGSQDRKLPNPNNSNTKLLKEEEFEDQKGKCCL